MPSSDRVIRSHTVRGASLLFFWLAIGFTLGTMVLLWPVRWLTAAAAKAGASEGTINALVIVLVLFYVIVSFVLAVKWNNIVCSRFTPPVRWAAVGLALLVTAGTAWAWRDPGSMLGGLAGGGELTALRTAKGAVFAFGGYPDRAKLEELKKQGVTTIISLQHPAVVVERDGMAEEQRATADVGLQLVKAPMLPWFSENEESLETIRKLALGGTGAYYVHCGLGRDRVNIVKKLIESLGATAVVADLHEALGFEGRQADFQQGSLVSLAPSVWLIPYPEKEEMYGCIFEGRPGHVVLLMDSAAVPQDSLMRESRRLLTSYGIPHTVIPLRDTTSARAAAAAKVVAAMKPPVTVIAYRTPWSTGHRQDGDEAAAAFRDAFAPNKTWRVTTTPTVDTVAVHAWTGGKEKGC